MNIFIEKSRLTQFANIFKFKGHQIYSNYEIGFQDGKIQTNIDLFIVGRIETWSELEKYGPIITNKIIYLPHWLKSVASAHLNEYIDCKAYRPLQIIDTINQDASQFIFDKLKYYIKLQGGARSLNTFIVNNGLTPASTVLAKLNLIKTKEQFSEFLESIKEFPGIKYIPGNVRYKDENLSYFKDWYAQEAMYKVNKEFRLIFTGENLYCFERIRNEANDGIVDNEFNYVAYTDIRTSIKVSLIKAFNRIGFIAGSADLVVSEGGEWSIVEISNQYGMSDIPSFNKSKIIGETLDYLIKIAESKF